MDDITAREKGYDTALRAVRDELQGADIRTRCSVLGIDYEEQENMLVFTAFGEAVALDTGTLELFLQESAVPADVRVQILVLRYLACDFSLKISGKLISYRELPGGSFYMGPFRGRTVVPLVKRIGNDVQELRRRMERFSWRDIGTGDFGAALHLLGALEMVLIYRAGDEEFPPDADILFDESVKRVYSAEDIAVMSALMCGKLIHG